jgi:Ca-activated chloride channel family protein
VNTEALKTLVADKRKSGVALTTLGFGEGNYNDALAEQLADVGNGNHYYIDTLKEGRKVLQDSLSATLMTIAKDVKIQIEFNPAVVEEYRLIGYEDRLLKREDFNNDKVDAGEIGAGHNVTALYELSLKGSGAAQIDPLRYAREAAAAGKGEELAFLRLRYKRPEQDASRLIERPIARSEIAAQAGPRLRFAAAVAAFADTLRGSTHLGAFDLGRVAALAQEARGPDPSGYRTEFVELVRKAQALKTPESGAAVTIAQ